MKNLVIGVFLGLLTASVWNNHVSEGQIERQPASIWAGIGPRFTVDSLQT